MAGTTFVAIPRERLLAAIEAMDLPTKHSRQGNELVVDIRLPNTMYVVRVYTSISVDGDAVRASGKDAVRIVFGLVAVLNDRFYPKSKPTTLKRTAPAAMTENRRVMAWVARFSTALVNTIDEAKIAKHLPCPRCLSPMIERYRQRDNKPFLGCLAYPQCAFTCEVPEGF